MFYNFTIPENRSRKINTVELTIILHFPICILCIVYFMVGYTNKVVVITRLKNIMIIRQEIENRTLRYLKTTKSILLMYYSRNAY